METSSFHCELANIIVVIKITLCCTKQRSNCAIAFLFLILIIVSVCQNSYYNMDTYYLK